MFIALSGPSGIGKGFLKDQILKRFSTIIELQWLTTRPLRENETPQGNRAHVSSLDFDSFVSLGECVLIQELYGNRYAVRLNHLKETSQHLLTEIHPANVQEFTKYRPDAFLIGITTTDHLLLRERLGKRGDTDTDVRIEAAQKEMALIADLRNHYHAIFTISKETEGLVCEKVLCLVDTLLNSNGI